MLPHYTPLKVAEQFRTLHALYPDRMDLGVGRAPGGGPVESLALRRERRFPPVDDFADQMTELLAFLHQDFPEKHPFAKIRVSPLTAGSPDVWLLGSSMWSSAAAAELSLPYAFAHFFSPAPTRAAVRAYQQSFVPGQERTGPEATVAVGVICADTQEEASYLHSSVRLLQRRIRQGDRRPVADPETALRELRTFGGSDESATEGEWPRYFVGTPEIVVERLRTMASDLGINEIIVNTITWDHDARLKSYELLSGAMGLKPPVAESSLSLV